MIPSFPEFKPLSLEDRAFFDDLFLRLNPLCSEYTFTNLFSWRHAWRYRVARFGDGALILREKKGVPSFLQPLVFERRTDAVKSCLGYLAERKAPPEVARVGEEFVSDPSFEAWQFPVSEDRDNFDYVYSVPALAALRGPDLHAKKNLVNQFKRTRVWQYRPLTRDLVAHAIRFQHEWCDERECFRDEGLEAEQTAIIEMLALFDGERVRGGVIEVDGRIAALTLGERLNAETLVIHLEKARGDLTGVYQAINQMFLAAEGAPYALVNREQDLGVPGLKRAKLSYCPERIVKKFSIGEKKP